MLSVRLSSQRTGRPTPLGERAEQQLLGVRADLRPEATADVRSDDAHLPGLEAVRGLDRVAGALRVLRARPLHEPAVDPRGSARAHLERARRDALVHDALRDDDLASVEEVRGGRLLTHDRPVDDHVRADVLEEQRRAIARVEHVDDRGQHFVVDQHPLGCVLTLVRMLGHDRDDRLADEPHLVGGERGAQHRLVQERHPVRRRRQAEVGGREHAEHAGCLLRVVGVDRHDAGVRDR